MRNTAAVTVEVTGSEPVAFENGRASLQTWRAFRREPLGMLALGILLLLVIAAVAAPLIAPYPPSYGDPVLASPNPQHWFGTDSLGRDVFGEVVWGSQQSILVAVAASAIAIVVGTVIAVIGAYFRAVRQLHQRAGRCDALAAGTAAYDSHRRSGGTEHDDHHSGRRRILVAGGYPARAITGPHRRATALC